MRQWPAHLSPSSKGYSDRESAECRITACPGLPERRQHSRSKQTEQYAAQANLMKEASWPEAGRMPFRAIDAKMASE